MADIEVHVLRLNDFTHPEGQPNAGERALVNGFLVTSPSGPILVDTGMGPPHPLIDKWFRPVRYDIDEALSATETGVTRDDIVAIANCHLHFDHCGGNQFFPGRPIYVQRAEYEAAHQANYTIPEFIDFPDAKYEQVEGRTEIAPRVTLFPTPGHSPGHQSVLLDTEDGLLVLGGQVAESIASLHQTPADGESAESLRKLFDLSPQRIYLGHDGATWTPANPEMR